MHHALKPEDRAEVTLAEVRAWARKQTNADGSPRFPKVGQRGHLPHHVLEAFNKKNRLRKVVDLNPWSSENRGKWKESADATVEG